MGNRALTIIFVEVDSADPSGDLDTIIEAGAAARGYSVEEMAVTEATADKAFRLIKT